MLRCYAGRSEETLWDTETAVRHRPIATAPLAEMLNILVLMFEFIQTRRRVRKYKSLNQQSNSTYGVS